MNVRQLQENISSFELLKKHQIIRKAFNGYENAEFQRLSIFLYKSNLTELKIDGFELYSELCSNSKNNDSTFLLLGSSMQVLLGKIDCFFVFADFRLGAFIFVQEKHMKAYIESLFISSVPHNTMDDNDFKPYMEDILKQDLEYFDVFVLKKRKQS